MRVWSVLLALSLLTLGACSNEVRSERPLFSARDSAGMPKFKAGLWQGVDKDCQADLTRPAAQ